jgi:hypothetical protein
MDRETALDSDICPVSEQSTAAYYVSLVEQKENVAAD